MLQRFYKKLPWFISRLLPFVRVEESFENTGLSKAKAGLSTAKIELLPNLHY